MTFHHIKSSISLVTSHSRSQNPSFLGHVVGKRGALEETVTGCQKILTSGCACAELTNITAHAHNGFLSLTAPLGEKFYSLSSLQRVVFWDVLKMHHFTQLGFTDNLELKEEDSNRNRLNTLLVCRTETINRQTIV